MVKQLIIGNLITVVYEFLDNKKYGYIGVVLSVVLVAGILVVVFVLLRRRR